MLIPRAWFEKLVASYDARVEDLKDARETQLQVLLAAKETAHQSVVAAKVEQIAMLEKQIKGLEDSVKHERTRAEEAINRLLAKDASVHPIPTAQPEPQVQDHRLKVVQDIFKGIASVGEDDPNELGDPLEVVETAGVQVPR